MFSTRSTPRQPRNSNIAGQLEVSRHPTKGVKYPHRLNFYSAPPLLEVTLEEFESWAIDRLKVLAEIEASQIRNRSLEEIRTVIGAQCKKYLPLSPNSARVDLDEERRKDHVSHFVLRLAFCRSEELRRRFIKAETALFRVRFESDTPQERQAFLSSLNFDWKIITQEEKDAHAANLIAVTPSLAKTLPSEVLFKVKWTRVPELVERRRVFVKAGFAYVPMREQTSLVLNEFTSRLSAALELTAKSLPRLDEDTRLLPVLSHLSMSFLAGLSSETYDPQVAANGGRIVTADMVDALAKHFPVCMRTLHDTLRTKRHLRHMGRLQYTLFLKAIGLSVEEAIVFWRKGYGGTMTDDKFNKEYKYNIRHSYGLEGSRRTYAPRSCQQILTGNAPGPQDTHGCPFRHYSPENLLSLLQVQYRITDKADLAEITNAVKASHFHVACTRVFEITHAERGARKGEGLGGGESVQHPNRYFERSVELWSEGKEDGEGPAQPDGDAEMKVDG